VGKTTRFPLKCRLAFLGLLAALILPSFAAQSARLASPVHVSLR
jgi:hypothetical protein